MLFERRMQFKSIGAVAGWENDEIFTRQKGNLSHIEMGDGQQRRVTNGKWRSRIFSKVGGMIAKY